MKKILLVAALASPLFSYAQEYVTNEPDGGTSVRVENLWGKNVDGIPVKIEATSVHPTIKFHGIFQGGIFDMLPDYEEPVVHSLERCRGNGIGDIKACAEEHSKELQAAGYTSKGVYNLEHPYADKGRKFKKLIAFTKKEEETLRYVLDDNLSVAKEMPNTFSAVRDFKFKLNPNELNCIEAQLWELSQVEKGFKKKIHHINVNLTTSANRYGDPFMNYGPIVEPHGEGQSKFQVTVNVALNSLRQCKYTKASSITKVIESFDSSEEKVAKAINNLFPSGKGNVQEKSVVQGKATNKKATRIPAAELENSLDEKMGTIAR